MNIDWEGVADEALDTPRQRLLQALEHADDMVSVLIVYEEKGATHYDQMFGYHAGMREGGSSAVFLGLAEWARAHLLDGMLDGETK